MHVYDHVKVGQKRKWSKSKKVFTLESKIKGTDFFVCRNEDGTEEKHDGFIIRFESQVIDDKPWIIELWVNYRGGEFCVGQFDSNLSAKAYFNDHKEMFRDFSCEKQLSYGTPIYRKLKWKQMNDHMWTKEYIEPASEKFYRYPKEFSRTPTALCAYGENTSCTRGEFGVCYCKLGCSAKRELDGSGQMLASEMVLLNNAIAAVEAKKR